ncbi:MAG: hypothetical protein GY866_17545 [Proteobacteria bacterium]|nr:hypothetical protein [Pseudomonadota bacterium]
MCSNPLPEGQSFYEDHGVKVCLACFRTAKRCQRCRFPSNSLREMSGYGFVCEFCEDSVAEESGMTCFVCQAKIWSGASHYADHGKVVCQNCFKDAKVRCFTCRFPHIDGTIVGLGGICRFCRKGNIGRAADLNPLLKPLNGLLKNHKHRVVSPVDIQWLDWRVILGMQMDDMRVLNVKFFDELIRHCYPVFYLKEKFYVIPSIPQQWFLTYMSGQLAAADLCQKYDLPHLLGNSPFHLLARGWCHWISYNTARLLKFKKAVKFLDRFPESELSGDSSKFVAMTEFRKPKEIIDFGQQNLKKFAKKYL